MDKRGETTPSNERAHDFKRAATAQTRDDGDSLYELDKEGVPIARDPAKDAFPVSANKDEDTGFTGGAHQKKRQATENAAKRSDTGTGL